MEIQVQQALLKDEKMAKFLKQNSQWIKYLNRNSDNYPRFVNAMKEKYHIKVSDKISDAIDNIDLISSVLEAIK